MELFLVQVRYDNGEYADYLKSEYWIIDAFNEMDFNCIEDIRVFDLSEFGNPKELFYVGWQPGCLIQLEDMDDNIIISGYGKDH